MNTSTMSGLQYKVKCVTRKPTLYRSGNHGYQKLQCSSPFSKSSHATFEEGKQPKNDDSPISSGTKSTQEKSRPSSSESLYRPSLNVIASNMAFECGSSNSTLQKGRSQDPSVSSSSCFRNGIFGVPNVVSFKEIFPSTENIVCLSQAASPTSSSTGANCSKLETVAGANWKEDLSFVTDSVSNSPNRHLNPTDAVANANANICQANHLDNRVHKCLKIQPSKRNKRTGSVVESTIATPAGSKCFHQIYTHNSENLSIIASPVMKKENHTVNIELSDWSFDVNFDKEESSAIESTDWVTFGSFDESPELSFSSHRVAKAEVTHAFASHVFMPEEFCDVKCNVSGDATYEKLISQLEILTGRLLSLESIVQSLGSVNDLKYSSERRNASCSDLWETLLFQDTAFVVEDGERINLSQGTNSGNHTVEGQEKEDRIAPKKRKMFKPRFFRKKTTRVALECSKESMLPLIG